MELTQNYGALADDEESRHRPAAAAAHGDGHGGGHGGGHGDGHGHGGEFNFGEVMVHQVGCGTSGRRGT